MRAFRVAAVGVVISAALGVGLAAPASAQSLLEIAGQAAHDRGEPGQRWAFTQTITRDDSALSARFDPSRPEGERWTLLTPAQDALTDEQQAIFNLLTDDQAPDVEVIVGGDGEPFDMANSFGVGAALLREDAGEVVFGFSPSEGVSMSGGGDGEDQRSVEVSEHLTGEVMVSRDGPTLRAIRVYATDSFKPHPVARITRLDITMTYGEIEPGGPLALVSTSNEVAGRALFQAFEESFQITNSDFVRVDGPPPPHVEDAR